MSDSSLLYPEFSGITEIIEEKDQIVLTLSESFSYIPLLYLTKELGYTLQLHCKKNTKNTVFLHSAGEKIQRIHINIVLEKNSEVFFIQQYDVCKGSKLDVKVCIDSHESSVYKDFSLIRNEGKVLFDIKNTLLQRASRSEIHSLYIGKDDSDADIVFSNESQASESKGFLHMRNILLDRAQCFSRGIPFVSKQAKNCASHLEQRSLSLGSQTQLRLLPQLSIANNQVEASHSSSVSSFLDEDLYFLQSRGLSKEDAKELLIEAFSADVLSQIPSPEMQECFHEKVKNFYLHKKF